MSSLFVVDKCFYFENCFPGMIVGIPLVVSLLGASDMGVVGLRREAGNMHASALVLQ